MRHAALAALILFSLCAQGIEIRGRVLDPDGKPAAVADVWLSRARIVSVTKTDEEGAFRFSDTVPGLISLTARSPEFAVTGLSGYVFDDLSVDLHMTLPDTVRIRVIDHAGKPVEGARVKRLVVNDAFEIFPADLAQHGFPSIRSDSDGAIAILGVPEGSHVAVTLEHRKFCDLFLPYLVAHPEQHPAQMYPGEVLRGHVTKPDGTGLAHARVLLFQGEDEERMLRYDVLADSEGYYRTLVPPGRYSLEVHHPDYPTPAPRDVRIVDATDEAIVDAAVATAHTIDGTILGPDEKPMAGVAVTYLFDDYVQDETYTDGKGRYRLTVSAGDGRVHVIPPPGFMAAEPLDLVVRIEKIAHTDVPPIGLKELPALSGQVADTGDGRENVLVRTLNLTPPLYQLTDAEGRFDIRLQALPDESSVELRAEHATRFLRGDFTIDIRDEKPDSSEVRLRPFQPDVTPNEPRNAPNDLSRLVDEPAPALTCRAWINSNGIALEDLRGKVVVLVLWAGFDPYGRNVDVLSEVALLHRALATSAEDVAFVGIHDDSDPPDIVEEYARELGLEFPIGVDATPRITHNRYDSTVLPQVVLIDKKGVVRYFDVKGRLSELIKDLRRRP